MKTVSATYLALLRQPDVGGIARRITITKSATAYDVTQYLTKDGIGRLSFDLEDTLAEFKAGMAMLRFSNRKAEGAAGTDYRFFNASGTALFDDLSVAMYVKIELGLTRASEYVTVFEGPLDSDSIRRIGPDIVECTSYDWLANLDSLDAEIVADASGYPRNIPGISFDSPQNGMPVGVKRISYVAKGGFNQDTLSIDAGPEITVQSNQRMLCATKDGHSIGVTFSADSSWLPKESIDDQLVIINAGGETRTHRYPYQNTKLATIVDALFDAAGMTVDYNLTTIPTSASELVNHYVGAIWTNSTCFPRDVLYVGTSGGLPCIVWLLVDEAGVGRGIWKATVSDDGSGNLSFSAAAIVTGLSVMRLFWADSKLWAVGTHVANGWYADNNDYIYEYDLQGNLWSSTKFPDQSPPTAGNRYRRETFYLYQAEIWHALDVNTSFSSFPDGDIDAVQIQKFYTASKAFTQRGSQQTLIARIYGNTTRAKNGGLVYDSTGDLVWVAYLDDSDPYLTGAAVFKVSAAGTWTQMANYTGTTPDDWAFDHSGNNIVGQHYYMYTPATSPVWIAIEENTMPCWDAYLNYVTCYVGSAPAKFDAATGHTLLLTASSLRRGYAHSASFIGLGSSTKFVTMDTLFPLKYFFPVLAQQPLSPFVEYANFEGMSVRDALKELAKVYNCVIQCPTSLTARFWTRGTYSATFALTSSLYARLPLQVWSQNRYDGVEVKTDIDQESETFRKGDFSFGKRILRFQSRFLPRGYGNTLAETLRSYFVTRRKEWEFDSTFLIHLDMLDRVAIDWPASANTLLIGMDYDDRRATAKLKLWEII